MRHPNPRRLLSLAILSVTATLCPAVEIVVDYSFDTNNFFDTAQKRDAIEAAAARYSRVLDSPLSSVGTLIDIPCNGGTALCPAPWRLGLSHPGTGELYELSTAEDADSDPISEPADEYAFEGLNADQWILFVGGRPLEAAALGGTATGLNFTGVFDQLDGPLHRGVIANTPDNSTNDLPAWGGSVTFSTNTEWHFDLDEPSISGDQQVDFYSIALHEIGHALGIATSWNQWQEHIVGTRYSGANALAALNADNDSNATFLELSSSADPHWKNGEHKSFIFSAGEPSEVGTVGSQLQDLLLDPTSNFSSQIRRFELTNVDAAALEDIGWSIIESQVDPLDLNRDLIVNGDDLNLACSSGQSLAGYYEALGTLEGDIDLDGAIQFSDFLLLADNFGSTGTYTEGDITCDGSIAFADFLLLSDGFGDRVAISAVPEPAGAAWFALPVIAAVSLWRRTR